MKNIKKWLQEPCEEKDIRYLDEAKKIAYLPIGIVENYLDEMGQWNTNNFKFNIYKTSNFWLASGSVELLIHDNDNFIRTLVGACTFPISSKDDNMDYEATILSFCIANAAKKLGKKFGRHLNGRLEKGETAFLISTPPQSIEEEKIENDLAEVKKKIELSPDKETANSILNNSGFKFNNELKNIINNKSN